MVTSKSRGFRPGVELLSHPAFRLLFAILLLATHLVLIRARAKDLLFLPFNVAPGAAPEFVPPDAPVQSLLNWNRMIVSRWDAQHYLHIALRGYSLCPPADLRAAELAPLTSRCAFNFYPGYPVLGRIVTKLTSAPADYALFGVSLAASLLFLYLYTGPAISRRLGIVETYLSLILLNAFTTGFTLVTVQTEPVTLVSLLGGFVLFCRGQFLAGALVAGAAGAFRVTGAAIGLAFASAVLFNELSRKRAGLPIQWLRLLATPPLAVWGQLAVFGYFYFKYKDPLLYVHTHSAVYAHAVSIYDAFFPDPRTVAHSLTYNSREGFFIAASAIWLALGLRGAMRRFPAAERAYWLVSLAGTLGLALVGSAGLAYAGMNRYLLISLPLFFAMACVLKRRPAALLVWLVCSGWSYWCLDLPYFIADRGKERLVPGIWAP